MAMSKVTCMQEKDGSRKIVTEEWTMLFQPLDSPETYDPMEHTYFLPEFRVVYWENGTKTWLGNVAIGSAGLRFFQQNFDISDEVAQRLEVGNEILWRMEQLEKVQ